MHVTTRAGDPPPFRDPPLGTHLLVDVTRPVLVCLFYHLTPMESAVASVHSVLYVPPHPLSELPLLLASPGAIVPACTASSRPSLLQLGFLMIFCTKESCVEPVERKSKDELRSQSGSLVCWFKKV